MTTFAENLRYYREKAKYSQKDLAKIIDVSVAAYNKYETRGNEPKIDILIKLAIALDIDVNTLVGFQKDSEVELDHRLQRYMEYFHQKDFIVKNDDGYIVHLSNGAQFPISKDGMGIIVNACIREASQHSDAAIAAVVNIKEQYFYNQLAIELRNYFGKLLELHGDKEHTNADIDSSDTKKE